MIFKCISLLYCFVFVIVLNICLIVLFLNTYTWWLITLTRYVCTLWRHLVELTSKDDALLYHDWEEILKITFNICGLICHFLSVVRCLLVKQGKWHIASLCVYFKSIWPWWVNKLCWEQNIQYIYEQKIYIKPESQAEQITNNNDKKWNK